VLWVRVVLDLARRDIDDELGELGGIAGTPRTVREFISEFRGLSGTAKQKTVLDAVAASRMSLGEFFGNGDQVDTDAVAKLLAAMREHSRPIKPKDLGSIGKDHLLARLEAAGVAPESFDYRKAEPHPRRGYWPSARGRANSCSGIGNGRARRLRLMRGCPRAAPWRLHDVRRSVATGMAEIGIQPHIIESVINHVSGHKSGVAGVYNRASYVTETGARSLGRACPLDRRGIGGRRGAAEEGNRMTTFLEAQRLARLFGAEQPEFNETSPLAQGWVARVEMLRDADRGLYPQLAAIKEANEYAAQKGGTTAALTLPWFALPRLARPGLASPCATAPCPATPRLAFAYGPHPDARGPRCCRFPGNERSFWSTRKICSVFPVEFLSAVVRRFR
jgi:hypothetical protein